MCSTSVALFGVVYQKQKVEVSITIFTLIRITVGYIIYTYLELAILQLSEIYEIFSKYIMMDWL